MQSKTLSKRAAARELGVAPNALREAIVSGRVRWPAESVDALRTQWLAASNAQGPSPLVDRGTATEDAGESLASARRRKEIALANMREDEFRKNRGEWIQAAVVVRGMAERASRIKNKLLAIPAKVKTRVPDVGLPAIAVIDACIREALEDLADGK